MKAMRVHPGRRALVCEELEIPEPRDQQLLIQVSACGVCRTDLHVLDGELPDLHLPLTPGHEVVGTVVRAAIPGPFVPGDRVGVPWLAHTCGACSFCRGGQENLCADAQFTGYTCDGGYAEYLIADWRYCLAIPRHYSDIAAAPLLCAGLIGYRAYRAAGEAAALGLYGFGASAHLLAQLACAQHRRVYAFTRPGDVAAQNLARSLGATWAGASCERPPEPLDAAIIFAPLGSLIPQALAACRRGGRVVCAGIHMSDVPAFPYSLLWGERTVTSVANLTRRDGQEFMALASDLVLRPHVETYPLEGANEALERLRGGNVNGCAVLAVAR
ncbi:MAG: zinc-dependent alcohol dehydrogenase family protein [Proteobacteria bacterium]|nr:zinc-dependent alcohol dehydrogenase family protein [Pseudomonadota bacterium]